MPTYKAPVEDSLFLINDVFHVERYNNLPGFAEATPETIAAVLGEGGKFCEEVLAPLNRIGDEEGCKRHPDGSVTTHPHHLVVAHAPLRLGELHAPECEPHRGSGLLHPVQIGTMRPGRAPVPAQHRLTPAQPQVGLGERRQPHLDIRVQHAGRSRAVSPSTKARITGPASAAPLPVPVWSSSAKRRSPIWPGAPSRQGGGRLVTAACGSGR